MCKQLTFVYECGHQSHYRESTCNKRKVVTSGSASHAACRGFSYIHIHRAGECNTCQVERATEEIEFSVEAIKIGISDLPDDNQEDAETWGELQKLQLYKQIPPQLKKRPDPSTPVTRTWQSRRRCKRVNSLLSREVKPDAVVGHDIWDVDRWPGLQIDEATLSEQQKMWDATWDVDVPDEAEQEDRQFIDTDYSMEANECEEGERHSPDCECFMNDDDHSMGYICCMHDAELS